MGVSWGCELGVGKGGGLGLAVGRAVGAGVEDDSSRRRVHGGGDIFSFP